MKQYYLIIVIVLFSLSLLSCQQRNGAPAHLSNNLLKSQPTPTQTVEEMQLKQIQINKFIEELRNVKTKEEEQALFTRMFEDPIRVGFGAYDKAGDKLPVTQQLWWEELHTLELHLDGVDVRYEIIDYENVFILMQE